MRRFGQVIGLKPEQIEAYERLHAAVWPDVLATIAACNIRNYSIFRYNDLLFAYFEYHGDDYEADMAKMAADPGSGGAGLHRCRFQWRRENPASGGLP